MINGERILALVLYDFYQLKHGLGRVVDVFFWPVLEVLIWGLTIIYIQKGITQNNLLIPLFLSVVLFWLIISRSQSQISSPLIDHILGQNLKNFLISPLTLTEFILAIILSSLVRLAISLGIAFLAATFLFGFRMGNFGLATFPLIANLLVFGWSLGLIAGGLIIRFRGKLMFFSWTIASLIQPIACVFYSRSILPPFLKFVSFLVPPSYIFETVRRIILGDELTLSNLIIPSLLNLLYFVLSIAFFFFLVKEAKKRGVLVYI